uniref:Protein kinase domain-containing protein n=1 Tax=Piliocolobus tephrosceles TaxID=591936 RepID=A0A8C9HPP9_9PRIM
MYVYVYIVIFYIIVDIIVDVIVDIMVDIIVDIIFDVIIDVIVDVIVDVIIDVIVDVIIDVIVDVICYICSYPFYVVIFYSFFFFFFFFFFCTSLKKLYLDEQNALYFFRKIVEGLKYMHNNNIAHRDLKPENIFLCKKVLSQKEKTLVKIGKLPVCTEYELKIGDFGACCFTGKNKFHYDIVGTLSYAAPEVLGCNDNNGYDSEKADVWSLGIILYAMLFGFLPYDNEEKDINEAYQEILKSKLTYPKSKINKISIHARNLLTKMLNVNPYNRLSLDEVVKHEWLADTTKSNLEVSYLNKNVNFPMTSMIAYPGYINNNIVNYNLFRDIDLVKVIITIMLKTVKMCIYIILLMVLVVIVVLFAIILLVLITVLVFITLLVIIIQLVVITKLIIIS